MTDVNELVDRVGAELVGAVDRYQRRRRRRIRRAAAAAGALAMVATVVLVRPGLPGGSSPQALAITPDGSSITVTVTDAAADPATMTAQLREAGVNARVQTEPVPASDVGHWIAGGTIGHATPEQSDAVVRDLAAQVRVHPDYLKLDKGLAPEISLIVGRAARPGEPICAKDGAVVINLNGTNCALPGDPRSGAGADQP